MNNDFKKKLKDYSEGKLSEHERNEIEKELEKLEQYQEFLDEQLDEQSTSNNDNDSKKKSSTYKNKNHSKTLKISKWKARIQNAFTAIGIFILFTIVSSIITGLFYSYGEPDRMEIYRDVTRSTIAITHPNIQLRSSSMGSGAYFTASIKGELRKRVGMEDINAGEVDLKFLFGNGGYNGLKLSSNKKFNSLFCYPNSLLEVTTKTEWERLEKLPDGTVAETYIYLDKFYETNEILKKFKNKEVYPLWFAVDTGVSDRDIDHDGYVSNPIGFPYSPLWHDDDMILESRTEEKGGFSELRSSPHVEPYGSGDIRNANFIKTLMLINKYESIAKRVSFSVRGLEKKIDYINENGVKIYGVVITGPSKEILNLKNEEWVKGIEVGEVRLWNWR